MRGGLPPPALPNHSLEHSSSGAGPGMLWQKQEIVEVPLPGKGFEGAIPGRSLVPAAQAQAARSR